MNQIENACQQYYIDTNKSYALKFFIDAFAPLVFQELRKGYENIVLLCIGTDRSTGDSLGPLVGYKLSAMKYDDIFVHGTLENPVHAKNINNVSNHIKNNYSSPLIIAVDACLGQMEHIGYISVGKGSIKPGSAVKKDISPVGDIYITGVVNFCGALDFLVLQNTRLNVVMRMADIISSGIRYVLWQTEKRNRIIF